MEAATPVLLQCRVLFQWRLPFQSSTGGCYSSGGCCSSAWVSSLPRPVCHMTLCVQSVLDNPTVVTCFKHLARHISSLRLYCECSGSGIRTQSQPQWALCLCVCPLETHLLHSLVDCSNTASSLSVLELQIRPWNSSSVIFPRLCLRPFSIEPACLQCVCTGFYATPFYKSSLILTSDWNTEILVNKSEAHFKAALSCFDLCGEICS